MANEKVSVDSGTSEVIETLEGKETAEVCKGSTGLVLVELIEYVPGLIVRKTVVQKRSGQVTVDSFDADELLSKRISRFPTCIQIIEGKAEIIIAKKKNILLCGESMIIPAHVSHVVRSDGKFKMLQTTIKSGAGIDDIRKIFTNSGNSITKTIEILQKRERQNRPTLISC
jgi:quercetin dioxygenase-like cupin family protein